MSFEEFQKLQSELSLPTVQSASLAIGKLLEELGQLTTAMSLYEGVSDYSQNNRFTHKIQAQILRLSCLLRDLEKVSFHYLSLEMSKTIDASCEFDTQHALMHADCLLHGASAALSRISRIQKIQGLDQFSERLVIFDYIFEMLRKNESYNIPSSFFEKYNYYACDIFEQVLWDIYLHDMKKASYESVTHLRSAQQSPMWSIRTLHLIQLRKDLETESEIARSKFLLMLQQIDPHTRVALLKAWPVNEPGSVVIDFTEEALCYREEKIYFVNQNIVKELVRHLTDTTSISTENLVVQLYGLEVSSSTLSRLKVLISRINKAVETSFGISKIIQFNKSRVSLKNSVQIRKAS